MAEISKYNEIMTAGEVAEYLQLAEKTVLRMAQRGEIPAAKIASQWRFMRPVIRDWLAGQMQSMPSSELATFINKEKPLSGVKELLKPELMVLDIEPDTKDKVLKQLVRPLRESGFAKRPDEFLESLIERERMMTTAVGHGIAVPHPRQPIERMFKEPAIILGVCKNGTNFEAIDDQLVHVFFLICATREEIHLQLMAKIAWLARDEKVISELSYVSSKQQAEGVIKKAVEVTDAV